MQTVVLSAWRRLGRPTARKQSYSHRARDVITTSRYSPSTSIFYARKFWLSHLNTDKRYLCEGLQAIEASVVVDVHCSFAAAADVGRSTGDTAHVVQRERVESVVGRHRNANTFDVVFGPRVDVLNGHWVEASLSRRGHRHLNSVVTSRFNCASVHTSTGPNLLCKLSGNKRKVLKSFVLF